MEMDKSQKDKKMISDDLGQQLHDRSTRGEILSADEQAQLEEWYASQDQAESGTLGLTAVEPTLSRLQAQVDAALIQLTTVTKRIQDIAAENESLRREIATLRRQLANLPASQPA
jgi:peptidoglycan hydrolase CwlO-like protein